MLLLVAPALAGEWWFRHQLAATYWPEGLRYAFTAEHRVDLTQKTGLLWDDTFAAPSLYAEVTPAYARVGPGFHLVPLAPLDIEGELLFNGYFGSFSGVTDFPEPDSDYRDPVWDLPEVEARARAGIGLRARLTLTPQAKVGRFIVALPQDFYYQWQQRPTDAAGDHWYEPQMDALMKWSDLFMNNGALAFWAFREDSDADPRFVWAGLRFDHQYVFGTGDRQLKAGPMVVFQATTLKWFPTVVIFAQAWIASGGDPPVHDILPPYTAVALLW